METREDELEQLGPRLAGNLSGKAFEAIADISRPDLKTKEGWKYLLQFLEKKRGKEKVDLLGDAFTEFFIRREDQRRDGEELSDYALRFSTLVRRLDKAVKESGAEGRIPQELYGWFLLNLYMRMDASDVANVRGRADSYTGLNTCYKHSTACGVAVVWSKKMLKRRRKDMAKLC